MNVTEAQLLAIKARAHEIAELDLVAGDVIKARVLATLPDHVEVLTSSRVISASATRWIEELDL